jgi:hypothetical protein
VKLCDLLEQTIDLELEIPYMRRITLYFGGCRGLADNLQLHGFFPTVMSKNKKLPLFSSIELAKEYAKKNNCESIVEVKNIPANKLFIDLSIDNPPDDIWEAIDRINNGEDMKLFLVRDLPNNHFTFINKIKRYRQNLE